MLLRSLCADRTWNLSEKGSGRSLTAPWHEGPLFPLARVHRVRDAVGQEGKRDRHQSQPRPRTDQHVGAALELFASVALLFWYVLRLLMSLNRR